jgi:D-3-phosphoglycerate dehydrogenase
MSIRLYNNISKSGLSILKKKYKLCDSTTKPKGILIRSHNLHEEPIPSSVLGIARCGVGVNNIPVETMTNQGVVVFNTPGSNANSVKELTLTGMLLASRNIVQGINYVNNFGQNIDMNVLEKDKKLFQGSELMGKTVGIIGLGNIGKRVAESCHYLGMNVIGYDSMVSFPSIKQYTNISKVIKNSDFLSIHIPYIKGQTDNLLNECVLNMLKPNVHILNFARNGIINEEYLLSRMENKHLKGYYITDFPSNKLVGNPQVIQIPHLGATTKEASENSTSMAAEQLNDYLENGCIKNSVNFPDIHLDRVSSSGVRLSIINENYPGVISEITSIFTEYNINIIQQINKGNNYVAYNLFDLDFLPKDKETRILNKLNNIKNIIKTRIIYF